MIIAQISDLHISGPEGRPDLDYATADHLARCVVHLNALDPRPDLVMASGDLVDQGSAEEYRRLAAILKDLELPWRPRINAFPARFPGVFHIGGPGYIYIYIHSIHISGSAPSVTWSCVNIHMEICNFAMAKGLQCVLALFPRNNRFSESFLALFRAKWAVLRPFSCILRISTAPPRFGSGR